MCVDLTELNITYYILSSGFIKYHFTHINLVIPYPISLLHNYIVWVYLIRSRLKENNYGSW